MSTAVRNGNNVDATNFQPQIPKSTRSDEEPVPIEFPFILSLTRSPGRR